MSRLISFKEEVTGVHVITAKNVIQESVLENMWKPAVRTQSRKKFQVPTVMLLNSFESCGLLCSGGCYNTCVWRGSSSFIFGVKQSRQSVQLLDIEDEGSTILLNVGYKAQVDTAQQTRRLASPCFKM